MFTIFKASKDTALLSKRTIPSRKKMRFELVVQNVLTLLRNNSILSPMIDNAMNAIPIINKLKLIIKKSLK